MLAFPTLGMSAQTCTLANGVWAGPEVGVVSHDIGPRVDGAEVGLSAGVGSRRTTAQINVNRTELSDATGSPTALRATMERHIVTVRSWSVCGTGHAAASRFVAGEDSGDVLAGGLGISLARPFVLGGAPLRAFVEGRGLGARSQATILDTPTESTGLSAGWEAGVSAALGPVRFRVAGSMDGFAPGLGATPYPARALRLGIVYRF
jgi:hypothetical protein